MQKLVKKDKLGDSGGASYTPTCSSANKIKESIQLSRIQQLGFGHFPLCCSFDSILSPLGQWVSLSHLIGRHPMVLGDHLSQKFWCCWQVSFNLLPSQGGLPILPCMGRAQYSLSCSHRNYIRDLGSKIQEPKRLLASLVLITLETEMFR